jgi:Flp pilus assembly protein TadD
VINARAGNLPVADRDQKAPENLAAEGWRLWFQRKLPEAEAKLEEAVKKDPANVKAWNGLGWAQLNQGKTLNARESFQKCATLDPKAAAAMNGLGWIAKAQAKPTRRWAGGRRRSKRCRPPPPRSTAWPRRPWS